MGMFGNHMNSLRISTVLRISMFDGGGPDWQIHGFSCTFTLKKAISIALPNTIK